ncbi:MAG: hypothetical protein HYZ72_11755 [Deltaproteobacteria bacterium]|nr:hypothetical protein [Deltaproteobacteria bacterium]
MVAWLLGEAERTPVYSAWENLHWADPSALELPQLFIDQVPTGAQLARGYLLALPAEAYEKVGRIEEGLTALTEALTVVDKTGERWYEAELHRLKGELSLQSRPVKASHNKSQASLKSEAEECFLQALEIARRQQAKSLESRATMSLARLWQQQGKKRQARQMLVEIYGWFTEGFDTKDLQEAKALLDSFT